MRILLLFPLLLFLVAPSPAAPPEGEIVTCTMVEPDRLVRCDPEDGEPDHIFTYGVSKWSEDALNEWRWAVEIVETPVGGQILAVNRPLLKLQLATGQKVKGLLDSEGDLHPVASCEVRIYREVRKHLDHGVRPPLSAWTPPEDCIKAVAGLGK